MNVLRSKLTARDWRNGAIVVALWFAIVGLPVFFIPETVLSDSPTAAQFTSLVASYVPMIDRTAKYSRIPEVLRFYFACLWAAAPLVFVALLVWGLPRVGRYAVQYDPVTMLIIFAVVGYVVYSVVTYSFGPDARTYRTLSSRLGLSFFGPLHVGVAVLGCAAFTAYAFGLLTGRLWRRTDEIEPDVK